MDKAPVCVRACARGIFVSNWRGREVKMFGLAEKARQGIHTYIHTYILSASERNMQATHSKLLLSNALLQA